MSPVPDVTNATMILSQAANTTVLNDISSSDELDSNMFNRQDLDLGSLAVDTMDNINLSDDDEPPTLTEDPLPQLTTCTAPSTPTGERDPPVIYRKSSTIPATTDTSILPQIEIRYQNTRTTNGTNSDDNNGLLGTFLGCFKPLFSAMNKFGENIRYTKDTKLTDDWDIPIDNIINDLEFIATGIEGSVFRGKLNGHDVACKRVKRKEETNVKHLKKLNHINVIKFRGISIAPPLFYIVMEYCAYGSLYELLKRRRDKGSCTKPTQVLEWSRQISNGVDYLHSNKLVHRDLKSPNILFFDQQTLKISDFGTSKELGSRRSQVMSFGGTCAWMAPEIIRQELCSEKIDVWSFGVLLWEILTCAIPYENIDPTAVMWGVGKGILTLPIPSSAPEGFRVLMSMCWNQRPLARPSFQEIIKRLDMSKPEIVLFEQEQEYAELTRIWSIEINEHLSKFPTIDISSTLQMTNDELMKKRQEELQHIVDIRTHYQKRVQQVNTLYIELKSIMMQLEQRERVIKEKERALNINGKKRSVNPISEARKKSLELIKMATSNLNDPMHLLSHKKQYGNKSNNGSSNSQSSNSPYNISDSSIHNLPLYPSSLTKTDPDLLNTKNISRRKKGSAHRRNNSKGSATSWTPPSLLAIDDKEKRRSSICITDNITQEAFTTDQILNSSSETIPMTTTNSPLPSISAEIDLKSNANNRELNPKNLEVDFPNSIIPSLSSSNHQRYFADFSIPPRKSSSSGPEDFDESRNHTHPRARRRRIINSNNSKSNSPSSATFRPIKSNDHSTSQINETDHHCSPKHCKNVTFHLSPSIANGQRKISEHPTYTSSEEGEVEEIHHNHYILNDEKHRAKHSQLCAKFSSESEIYGEKSRTCSDEGGHISDDRPQSLPTSELEQE